jgi:hypothetical protein
MIRRDDTLPDGSARWLLISQVEHARIAAELAVSWGEPPLQAVEQPEIVLPTIRRHDDGWDEWESQPAVDAEGKPVSFTEMSPADGNAIWQRSIESLADLGPLAQYLVASHFVDRRRKSTETSPERTAFVDDFERRRAEWFDHWQRQDPTRNTVERANRALRQLQFFDALSLWFCCEPRAAEESLTTPSGATLRLLPAAAAEIQLAPWPLRRPELDLEITARAVTRRAYSSSRELASVGSESVVLRIHLSPAT